MTVDLLKRTAPWPTLAPDGEYPQLNGHDQAWFESICKGLKHQPFVLVHRDNAGVANGILPLVLVQSLLFGKFLVSLPYLNTGGPWAIDYSAASELVSRACELADEHDVRYLELRLEKKIEHPKLTVCRTEKVHMRLKLPDTDVALDASFKSKLRSQVKKSNEHGLSIAWGRTELLDDFYRVFAINMRDLGTPVFSKNLFQEILTAFPNEAELCIVKKDSTSVAGGLLVHSRGVSEVPSASSLRNYNYTNANMWMYRNLLKRAIERGSHTFDFGRSSVDSGTYKFKSQWGAEPHPANWQYYVRKGSADEMRPDSDGKKKLVQIWQKLPVALTRIIGPSIIRGVP
ncbi:MAG: FemAB family PEP-CTERM system-associated protein [Pirellulaceae bacterium]|nr:FemAB family PEP-CTERM system-associated protein [Pirellulaceae bacterium]